MAEFWHPTGSMGAATIRAVGASVTGGQWLDEREQQGEQREAGRPAVSG